MDAGALKLSTKSARPGSSQSPEKREFMGFHVLVANLDILEHTWKSAEDSSLDYALILLLQLLPEELP